MPSNQIKIGLEIITKHKIDAIHILCLRVLGVSVTDGTWRKWEILILLTISVTLVFNVDDTAQP